MTPSLNLKLFPVTTYLLPDSMRTTLRRPLGRLVRGNSIDVAKVLLNSFKMQKPVKLILVGDTVSRDVSQAGIVADVMIIDNLEKRQKAIAYAHNGKRVIKAKNKAGKIEYGARVAVESAIRGEADLVEIDGEEDLLALIAVTAAPAGSLVVYGQPNEGVVLVEVSEKSKADAEQVLNQMERTTEA